MRLTLGIITPKAKPVKTQVVQTPAVQPPLPPPPAPDPSTAEVKPRAPWGSKKAQTETPKTEVEPDPVEVLVPKDEKVVDDKVEGG